MAVELTETKRNKELTPVKLPSISDVPGRACEIHELIARRAYGIYEGRGHVCGQDVEDWQQAKSEVLATLCVGFVELDHDLSVNIGIRASELPHLQVAIEPWRLVVSGKRNIPGRRRGQGHLGEKPSPLEIFQVVDFPVQVEPSGTKTTFSNGLLEFRIPKVAKREKSLAARGA